MWKEVVSGQADIDTLAMSIGIKSGRGYINDVEVPLIGRIVVFGVKDRKRNAGLAILPSFDEEEFEVYFWKEV